MLQHCLHVTEMHLNCDSAACLPPDRWNKCLAEYVSAKKRKQISSNWTFLFVATWHLLRLNKHSWKYPQVSFKISSSVPRTVVGLGLSEVLQKVTCWHHIPTTGLRTYQKCIYVRSHVLMYLSLHTLPRPSAALHLSLCVRCEEDEDIVGMYFNTNNIYENSVNLCL